MKKIILPFFHPAFTVAPGISPDPETKVSCGVYRREEISPFPESHVHYNKEKRI